MPMTQEELRSFWQTGKSGSLSPWQQALALGLREASKELDLARALEVSGASVTWLV